MRKGRKCRQAAALFLALCLFLGAGDCLCRGRNVYAASSVHMNQTSLTLTVGDTYKLVVLKNSDFSSYKGKVKWTSSRSSVARVSSGGMLTAVSAGSAVITAKAGSSTMKCKVTVKKAASNAAKKIRQLGNAIIQRGNKNKQDNYFFKYEINDATLCIIYEKNRRIDYYVHYVEDDVDVYLDMYHNPSAPEKVIMKGLFYYKKNLVGRTIATIRTSEVNADQNRNLGFHVQAGTYRSGTLKKSVVSTSETIADAVLPVWNRMVNTLTGMTMKDLGFTSL